jgi:branched-subunit amino acid transport protein AzlD
MTETYKALGLVLAMGAVILFCRAFPFLFFGRKRTEKHKASFRRELFMNFVETIVPPVAMTVLTFNALGGAFRQNLPGGVVTFAAASCTAVLHLWKRNTLISIFGGTALYMILTRVHIF